MKAESFKIIDCHANCGWDMGNMRKKLFPTEQTFRGLLRKMDDAGVSQAVILPFPTPGGRFNDIGFWYDVENHYLVQAKHFSPRFHMFAGVNPKDHDSVAMIDSLAVAYRIQGIKFSHQIPMQFDIDTLIDHPLMETVTKHNLLMMIHIGTGKEKNLGTIHTTLPYAMKVAKAYPAITFIFCHLGRLHKDVLRALSLPNVYMDTAGLALQKHWQQFCAKEPLEVLRRATPVKIIEYLVGAGFEDKIVFGSDEPYTSYDVQIGHIVKAEVSHEAKKKILGQNLRNLLRGAQR